MPPTLVFPLMLLLAVPLGAQERPGSDARTGIFVVPGILVSMGSGAGSGLGLAGDLVVERGRHRFAARIAGIADLRGFPDSGGSEHVTELGLLYGRRWERGRVDTSLSAGLSSVGISDCDSGGPTRACSTVGVPLVADAIVGSRVVGIGLQAFVNLNLEAPFGGVGVVVPLGWRP